MAENTKIEWADHSWSPWHGCAKVSPGCAHCYAERQSKRNPGTLGVWGPDGTRVLSKDWEKPVRWNRAAEAAGERQSVFPSICDPFEDRPELVPWRVKLFHLISETRNLDWLLLTKRPENVMRFCVSPDVPRSWSESMPPNCWLGVSVEDQQRADERIPALLRTPAAVRFLSCEPLLGPVDLRPFIGYGSYPGNIPGRCVDIDGMSLHAEGRPCRTCGWGFPDDPDNPRRVPGIDWCIVGGESGPGARPMHPDWARSLRDQCRAARVPFFFKQWGEWVDLRQSAECDAARTNGHNPGFCPIGLDGKSVPNCADRERGEVTVYKFGKKAAGRLLDGREWSEFPAAEARP